ncbi:hypothetical protein BGX21_003504 [Mortierella sp. AD011]|nr:hypothetical protein BGX20_011117 [Mortierella sp. AD010]KAF9376356.1 hypothetical protein BGX21_003504 [Mortierella sp. AD011]
MRNLRQPSLALGIVPFSSTLARPIGGFWWILTKRRGVFMIRSVGTDNKAEYLFKNLGLDVVISYKTKDLFSELYSAAPKGIDILLVVTPLISHLRNSELTDMSLPSETCDIRL